MNRKKFSNICSVFMIVGFLGFVFGLFALSAYENITDYSTYSYYENRNLTMLPEPDTDSVLDGLFSIKLKIGTRIMRQRERGFFHMILS